MDLAPLRLALADAAGFPFLQPFREAVEALMRDGVWEEEGLRWRLHLGNAVHHLEGALPPPSWSSSIVLPGLQPGDVDGGGAPRVRAAAARTGRGAADDLQRGHAYPRHLAAGGLLRRGGCVHRHQGRDDGGATRLESLENPLGARWLERWRRSSSRAPHGAQLTPELEERLLAHPQWRAVTG